MSSNLSASIRVGVPLSEVIFKGKYLEDLSKEEIEEKDDYDLVEYINSQQPIENDYSVS